MPLETDHLVELATDFADLKQGCRGQVVVAPESEDAAVSVEWRPRRGIRRVVITPLWRLKRVDRLGRPRGPSTSRIGTAHPQAKLSDWQVQQIRTLAARGVAQVALARRFGVHQSRISVIVRGQGWAHLGGPTRRPGLPHRASLVAWQVITIRQRLHAGESQKSLALAYGVSPMAIWCIAHHRTWRELAP